MADKCYPRTNVTSWNPIGGQQWDKHPKPGHCKVQVQEPGQELERVGRPAPSVRSGAKGYVCAPGSSFRHGGCPVWIFVADVHEDGHFQGRLGTGLQKDHVQGIDRTAPFSWYRFLSLLLGIILAVLGPWVVYFRQYLSIFFCQSS